MAVEDEDHQIGYQALPKGAEVVTSDGVALGTVHRVLDNAREHIFDGIVISTSDGLRFVDAPEVARITARRVTLNVAAAEAGAHMTVYQTGFKKTRNRWLRRFGG